MQSTNPNLPQVIDGCHELLKWLIPVLDKFPRARRFTLGERLESGLLAVLGECVDAAYSKHKRPQTHAAQGQVAQCTLSLSSLIARLTVVLLTPKYSPNQAYPG